MRSPEDVWTFTQRNVPLWDILEFFPPDAVGPRGPGDALVFEKLGERRYRLSLERDAKAAP